MTARTRTAKKATDNTPTPAPAKKTAAKRTTKPRTPRTLAARKTTTPGLSLVKNKPATDIDHRDPLPVRRRLFVGPMGATEQAAVRAALATAATRLPIPVRTWNGSTARLTDGTLLTHNPGPDRTFTAHIACRHGAIHGYPIHTARDLAAARAITHACQRKHADNTTSDLGGESDWNKAIAHGIQPTTRLAEGLQMAKKATADTQSLPLADIAADLNTRATADQAKEHPQP